jgi:hypothetical protein
LDPNGDQIDIQDLKEKIRKTEEIVGKVTTVADKELAPEAEEHKKEVEEELEKKRKEVEEEEEEKIRKKKEEEEEKEMEEKKRKEKEEEEEKEMEEKKRKEKEEEEEKEMEEKKRKEKEEEEEKEMEEKKRKEKEEEEKEKEEKKPEDELETEEIEAEAVVGTEAEEPLADEVEISEGLLINELNDLFKKLKNEEISSEKDKDEVRNKIQKYSKIIKKDLKVLKNSGAVISHLVAQYKEAGSHFKEDDYLKAIEIIIEVLREKEKSERDFFKKELENLLSEINETSDTIPSDTLKDQLSEIEERYSKEGDINSAIASMNDVKKTFENLSKYYSKAKKLIDVLEEKINKIKESGLNLKASEEILVKMKETFEANEYKQLPKLKNDCVAAIEASRKEYKEILESIKNTQKKIVEMNKEDIDVGDCNKLLKKAKRKLMAGEYSEAQEITQECKELAEKLSQE